MGDNLKILFPSTGFAYPGNSKKFFVILAGPNWSLGPFGSFEGKKGLFWDKFPLNFSLLVF